MAGVGQTIAINVDLACSSCRPICQDTGLPTFEVKVPPGHDQLLLYRKDFGGALGAKSAWPIMVYGLASLPTRVRQQMQTASEVASFLAADPRVQCVSYPGLPSFPQYELAKRQMLDFDGEFAPGILLYFVVGGKTPKERHDRAEKLINALAGDAYTITLAVSLGQCGQHDGEIRRLGGGRGTGGSGRVLDCGQLRFARLKAPGFAVCGDGQVAHGRIEERLQLRGEAEAGKLSCKGRG